ncbi:complex I NDUFA9 subunit family protein [Undibacterium jejuense]|uniref:Complex I NDUFA9 subunit family protein n=1 Tax=Undibacterium jejuense TaxID=1344949 RepID=A0A923HDM7_9BURK|nr:complex I NDUFA9 subunit family protein [Undibacterium jejuense]MBC3862096.1 complex I NDUFA9 subunit family protein [Undibacterium jejuense]
MNILLTGASGFLGSHICDELFSAGHTVKPISRRTGSNFCDMLVPSDWFRHLDGIDAVINAVGIIGETRTQRFEAIHALAPTALFKACQEAGIRRVIQISAIGTEVGAFSQYHRSKLKADQFLRSLDLDWLILRPGLVCGNGGSSTSLLMRLASSNVIPVINRGHQLLQPIYIADLASVVVNALLNCEIKQSIDIVGPQAIGFTELLQMMRRAQNLKPARLIPIPRNFAMASLFLGRFLHPLLHPDNFRMLEASYVADVAPTLKLLGRSLTPVATELFFREKLMNGETS